jgi:hypothetical protein
VVNEDFLLQVKKYGVLGFRIMSYYTEIIYVILKEKWCFVQNSTTIGALPSKLHLTKVGMFYRKSK